MCHWFITVPSVKKRTVLGACSRAEQAVSNFDYQSASSQESHLLIVIMCSVFLTNTHTITVRL